MNKLVAMKNSVKNRKGFTLVELIIVMVIIAILAAALIPTMMGYVNDARRTAYTATARAYYVAATSVVTKYSADGAVAATINAGAVTAWTVGGTANAAALTNWNDLTLGLPLSITTITVTNNVVTQVVYTAPDNVVVTIDYNPTTGRSTIAYS